MTRKEITVAGTAGLAVIAAVFFIFSQAKTAEVDYGQQIDNDAMTFDAQIKRIEADPHMPQQAKQMVIGMLNGRRAAAKAGRPAR